MPACEECLRRTWLLERISGYLEHQRRRIEDVLSLDDGALVELWRKRVQDELGGEYDRFSASHAEARRARAQAAGLELICACDSAYPHSLRRLRTPPAVLHVAGGLGRFLELAAADPVAIVGTRAPTSYGREVAERLGRGTSACGVTVVSGMALGVDAAAHVGALAGGGRTLAVLAGSAADPYPRHNARLHARILCPGAAVSELGPGASPRKWMFVARNRIIAALSRLTVVVQAPEGSGALTTAEFASRLSRTVGAVPGSVMVRQSDGPHRLLREGAVLIRDAQDVLDAVFGAGVRDLTQARTAGLGPTQQALLEAIAGGADTIAALTRSGVASGEPLSQLAALELSGHLRRVTGGRYVVVA